MSKTAYLFPGQGAQFVGMAGALTAADPAAKALFDQAKQILGYDLLEYCVHGPAERLNATDVSQPAIFVASLAALDLFRRTEPDFESTVIGTAGLSLGEYTALVFAGAVSFEDALRVVDTRGKAMQRAAEATPSGMVSALLLDPPTVEQVVEESRADGRIWIANYLCPGNTVLSGETAAVERAGKLIEAKGGKPHPLTVAGAFHTEIMRPADEELRNALDRVVFQAPRVPVWSNVDGKPHCEPGDFKDLLVRQVIQPVLWETCHRELLAAGAERFVEIGPGKVLAGLSKRINRKTECRNVPA